MAAIILKRCLKDRGREEFKDQFETELADNEAFRRELSRIAAPARLVGEVGVILDDFKEIGSKVSGRGLIGFGKSRPNGEPGDIGCRGKLEFSLDWRTGQCSICVSDMSEISEEESRKAADRLSKTRELVARIKVENDESEARMAQLDKEMEESSARREKLLRDADRVFPTWEEIKQMKPDRVPPVHTQCFLPHCVEHRSSTHFTEIFEEQVAKSEAIYPHFSKFNSETEAIDLRTCSVERLAPYGYDSKTKSLVGTLLVRISKFHKVGDDEFETRLVGRMRYSFNENTGEFNLWTKRIRESNSGEVIQERRKAFERKSFAMAMEFKEWRDSFDRETREMLEDANGDKDEQEKIEWERRKEFLDRQAHYLKGQREWAKQINALTPWPEKVWRAVKYCYALIWSIVDMIFGFVFRR